MNLLVIGNGFDLAHHLPTRYSDFLDFMTLCITNHIPRWQSLRGDLKPDDTSFLEGDGAILDELSRKIADNPKVTALFNDNQEKFKSILSSARLLDKFYENSILRYCLYAYDYKKSFDREFNWIDIENELLKLLAALYTEKTLSIILPHINGTGKSEWTTFYFPTVARELTMKNFPPELFHSEMFKYLFNELEDFSLMLRFYLQLVRDDFYNTETPKKVFQINSQDSDSGIFIDGILSFNYTDTAKIYTSNAPIYFINGSLKDKKIILGVENSSIEKTADYSNNNIHLFFKNVQRVLYDFSYEYSSLLTRPWAMSTLNPRKNRSLFNINVYIIGHSLAPSDRYILTDVMMCANTVTIYYHTESDKYSKTANLYQILGDERFTKHVNNPEAKPRIELVPQKSIMSEE